MTVYKEGFVRVRFRTGERLTWNIADGGEQIFPIGEAQEIINKISAKDIYGMSICNDTGNLDWDWMVNNGIGYRCFRNT